jgi:hypothetical protein
MSKIQITADTSHVERLLTVLSGDEKKRASLNALRTSANILKKETDKRFVSETKLDGKTVNYRVGGEKASKKINGIAKTVLDKKEYTAKVHIMRDFRAKFFEMGTKIRYTKGRKITGQVRKGSRIYNVRTGKGHQVGKMTGQWIFRAAKELTERRIFDNIEKEMTKSILKIAKKNGYT